MSNSLPRAPKREPRVSGLHPQAPFVLAIPEKNPTRIITWDDVLAAGDTRTLQAYYHQRLGPACEKAPMIAMSAADFQALIYGEHDIYARMWTEDRAAAAQLWFANLSGDPRRRVVMGTHLECENPMDKAIAYIASHKTDPVAHTQLLQAMVQLTGAVNRLYRAWKAAPVKYHDIALPGVDPDVA